MKKNSSCPASGTAMPAAPDSAAAGAAATLPEAAAAVEAFVAVAVGKESNGREEVLTESDATDESGFWNRITLTKKRKFIMDNTVQ